jgi:hypothetical protein
LISPINKANPQNSVPIPFRWHFHVHQWLLQFRGNGNGWRLGSSKDFLGKRILSGISNLHPKFTPQSQAGDAPKRLLRLCPIKSVKPLYETLTLGLNFGEKHMTNLTGKTPADTYGDILTVTNKGQGLPDTDPVSVHAGNGKTPPRGLSQTVVSHNAHTTLPRWTTKTRPKDPLVGSVGLNTDTDKLEVYASGKWFTVATEAAQS